MDTYYRKLFQIQCEFDKVDKKRQIYTEPDIRLVDQPVCMARLKEIEDAEDLCKENISDLICELDENVEADEARIKSIR